MRNYPYHSLGFGCGMPGQQEGAYQPGNGYPHSSPARQKPTQIMPAQYDPVKHFDENVSQDIVAPVVHPCHTTRHDQTNYKYMHSYSHTKSVVKSITTLLVRINRLTAGDLEKQYIWNPRILFYEENLL